MVIWEEMEKVRVKIRKKVYVREGCILKTEGAKIV